MAGSGESTNGRSYLPGLTAKADANSGYVANYLRQLNGTAYPTPSRKGLYIYKGTVPTPSDVTSYGLTSITALSATNPATFRASDLLLTYGISGAAVSGSAIALTLAQATAIASGTASWFCLGVYPGYGTYNGASYYPNLIVGTVTLTNGGGDIEMPSTSIISGNIYKMPQLELKFPFSYVV